MKRNKFLHLLFLIVVLMIQFFGTIAANEGRMVKFYENKTLDEIITILKDKDKPGMLYFRSKTCGWCDKLENEVFSIDSVITYIESNFVPVKCGPEWRKDFPIFGVPHTIIINNKGEVIDRIAGYYPADKFVEKLSYSAEGGVNKKAKREAKTYKDFKEAYEANPDDTEATWKYAEKLCITGDYKTAKPILESLTTVTLSDSTAEIWKFLYVGRCYERELNRKKAIESYKKAIDTGFLTTGNRKAMAYTRLVEICFKERMYEQSIKYSLMMPKEQEGNMLDYWWGGIIRSRIYLPLAYAFIGSEDRGRKELENLFKEASQEKYSFSTLENYCGMCLIYDFYLEDAIHWAEKSVELYYIYLNEEKERVQNIKDNEERKKDERNLKLTETESCYSILYTKAHLASRIGDFETAIKIWEGFPELPDSRGANYYRPRAKAYLGAVYIKSGQTEKGEKIFEEIMNNWEDKRNAYFWLALVCNEYKVKIKEAIEWSIKGIEEHGLGDVYWVTDALAGLYFENGEVEKAIEWEEKAIEQMPEDKFIRNLEKYKAALK